MAPDSQQLYATRVRGAPLLVTDDADALLSTLGCNAMERRRRGQSGRAFHPCPRCIRAESWSSRSARVLLTDAGWALEDRRLIRWFMRTRLRWLAVVVTEMGTNVESFFVPAWAQQIRIATDLLGWAGLTLGRHAGGDHSKTRSPLRGKVLRVDAPGLVNLAIDDATIRTTLMAVLSFLPAEESSADNATLVRWALTAKVHDKHRAAAALFTWLEANAPAVMADPSLAPPDDDDD